MKLDFSLVPFAADDSPAVKITGNIERQNNLLIITYKLLGASIIIIPETTTPIRQFDLWEHTCLELFLGLKDSTKYWEFNLSPIGHWNIFRFLDYRTNISEEMAFTALPFQVSPQNNYLQLNLQVNLDQIISPQQDLEVGITAVVEDRRKQLSYWALTHPAEEADFHSRNSFMIHL